MWHFFPVKQFRTNGNENADKSKILKNKSVFFIFLLTLIIFKSVHAQDHIVERGWFEDPTGELTWTQAQTFPTQPFEGTLSLGFGRSAIWIRLRIDPQAAPISLRDPERLVLRIRPVYLNDLQLYDPLSPEGLAGVTGDIHHPRQDEFEGLDFTLPIQRGNAPRDIWLRLHSTSTRQLHVEALSVEQLSRKTYRQALVFSGYLGLVATLALWGMVSWLIRRESVIAAFALAQSMAVGYAFFSLGHMRLLWPSAWPAWPVDHISSVLSIAAVSTGLLFHSLLLREFSPPRWATRLHLLMLCLLPLKLLLLASGQTMWALALNLSEVLWSPLLFLLSAWFAQGWRAQSRGNPSLSRPVLVGFYLLLVAMMLAPALPGLGLLPGTEMSLYLVQAHGLVMALLITLILQYRSFVIQQRHKATVLALERSQILAQKERIIREEQDKLMTMLAHELKTPLATMQLRLNPDDKGTPHVKKAIRDMNSVIDRCVQTAKLDDGQLVLQRSAGDVVKLIRDAVAASSEPHRVQFSAPGRIDFCTDRQLLFVVLSNLIENACKYGEDKQPIFIHASTDSERDVLIIEVRNKPGVAGWPDAQLVFDKYYRSPLARRIPGTGLGLHLTRSLVTTLQGEIRYAPDATWVRFVVTLPSLR